MLSIDDTTLVADAQKAVQNANMMYILEVVAGICLVRRRRRTGGVLCYFRGDTVSNALVG